MIHSLRRWQHLKPAPPFRLGGEFCQVHGRSYLKDCERLVELVGLEAQPQDLPRGGDQVSVEVLAEMPNGGVHAQRLQVHVQSKREHRLPPRPHAREFPKFQQRVREYFLQQGLLELQTPTMVLCPGLEPSLRPFRVGTHYLPTSPEIHLKKALANGWSDIFELKSCFRAGENSLQHAAEFTMLEWYRGFADLTLIQQDLEGLLDFLFSGRPRPQVLNFTFAQLFKTELDFDLRPSTTAADLRRLLQHLGLHFLPEDDFQDLFHRLLLERIEPALMRLDLPVVVRHFPPSLAALARLTNEGWADRFELYWEGLEIANAFHEVTDPEEQRSRWQAELDERARLGTGALPIDEELIQALESGMPPAGGIALGVERLYMAIYDVKDIRELKVFTTPT